MKLLRLRSLILFGLGLGIVATESQVSDVFHHFTVFVTVRWSRVCIYSIYLTDRYEFHFCKKNCYLSGHRFPHYGASLFKVFVVFIVVVLYVWLIYRWT